MIIRNIVFITFLPPSLSSSLYPYPNLPTIASTRFPIALRQWAISGPNAPLLPEDPQLGHPSPPPSAPRPPTNHKCRRHICKAKRHPPPPPSAIIPGH
ncbi:unnamed protein product [Merluccius merluccius]